MGKILVTETIAENALSYLRAEGHEVEVFLNSDKKGLVDKIKNFDALIIRSATNVDKEVIDQAKELKVIGRAGIGLDNVDVNYATQRGIMVVNAPESNILSAAEHTMGLLIALARKIPQAHNSLISGKWERSKFEGVELHGKTLGIIGLGKVGSLVAQRASAFGMKLIAYDPYVSKDRAKTLNITLVDLKTLISESDFITIHLPKTQETVGLINKELLKHAKKDLRIINTARGAIINEDDLYEALIEGKIAGCALDVFNKEPVTESPLFSLSQVVVTPHLGASTVEAQDKAGKTIAEQINLALKGDLVPYAVNLSAKDASPEVKEFVPLAEQMGAIFAKLSGSLPEKLEVEYQGEISSYDTNLLTLCIIKGILSVSSEDPVSFVNAMNLAKERGLEIKESHTEKARDYVNLILIRSESHSLGATLVGSLSKPRIVYLDDHIIEVPPSKHMLVVRNDDRPGMIGTVGTILGDAKISISSMAVGPSKTGNTALMVLSTDQDVPDEAVSELESREGILSVHRIGAVI